MKIATEPGPPRARLAAVTAALSAASPVEVVFGTPTGDGWMPLEHAMPLFAAWHRELAERIGDRRAAAAYLAAWIPQVALTTTAMPLLLGRVLPRLRPQDVRVRRHEDGWFDGHAGAPRSVVGAEDLGEVALFAAAARQIVAMTAPVAAAISATMPVGEPTVWAALADGLGAQALRAARRRGADQARAWRAAERLLDDVQAAGGQLRRRPSLLPVAWSQGVEHFCLRSTCCLYYRTVAAPARDGEGYCTTCPLRTAASRDARLRAHLAEATA